MQPLPAKETAPEQHRDIVVMGASAGGLDPLRSLMADLPPDLNAAGFIVQHFGAQRSFLVDILREAGPVPVEWAQNGMTICPGRFLVAPPDYHLLIADGRVALSRGPRENRARPAIDPLFRTAARTYNSRVIGVILSGMLSDGTAGFAEVKRHGGFTVVQDPEEAGFSGMPVSALRHTKVDYCLRVGEIASLLAGLAPSPEAADPPAVGDPLQWPTEEGIRSMNEGYDLKPPRALTCPICGGAVAQSRENHLPYFTCHIGQRFAAADFDAAQFQDIEAALERVLRMLNERAAFCGEMAESCRGISGDHAARAWEEAREEVSGRAAVLRQFIEQGWRRPDPNDDGKSQEPGD
jgi:two-component system, chemotaxis family, protein-glutamate methylesterase/glutaminase